VAGLISLSGVHVCALTETFPARDSPMGPGAAASCCFRTVAASTVATTSSLSLSPVKGVGRRLYEGIQHSAPWCYHPPRRACMSRLNRMAPTSITCRVAQALEGSLDVQGVTRHLCIEARAERGPGRLPSRHAAPRASNMHIRWRGRSVTSMEVSARSQHALSSSTLDLDRARVEASAWSPSSQSALMLIRN
jgi:hypothetical protein